MSSTGKNNNGMKQPEKVTSAAYLKRLLRENNLYPNRALGQHFLVDENITEKIIAAAGLTENDLVIDIGAGPGALTYTMAERASAVIAVEWDQGLAALLRQQAETRRLENLYVVQGDIRSLDLEKICRDVQEKYYLAAGPAGGAINPQPRSHALPPGISQSSVPGKIDSRPGALSTRFSQGSAPGEIKVVANLPYYLITPLLFKLLQGALPVSLLVLMVQLEVARRMMAAPGGKEYGLLSVLCRYYTVPRFLFKVSHHVFLPPPAVDSAVVLLDVAGVPPVEVKDADSFWQIVKAAFQKRRKTLLNALDGLGGLPKEKWAEILQKSEIAPVRRGETLSLEEFAKLSVMFYNNKGL